MDLFADEVGSQEELAPAEKSWSTWDEADNQTVKELSHPVRRQAQPRGTPADRAVTARGCGRRGRLEVDVRVRVEAGEDGSQGDGGHFLSKVKDLTNEDLAWTSREADRQREVGGQGGPRWRAATQRLRGCGEGRSGWRRGRLCAPGEEVRRGPSEPRRCLRARRERRRRLLAWECSPGSRLVAYLHMSSTEASSERLKHCLFGILHISMTSLKECQRP